MTDEGVEEDDELAQAGDECDTLGLPGFDEMLVEGASRPAICTGLKGTNECDDLDSVTVSCEDQGTNGPSHS